MSDARPGMGHNAPPGPVALVNPEGLDESLRIEWAHLFTRKDDLMAMVRQWKEDHPKGILSGDEAAQATDILTQVLHEADTVDKSAQVGIRATIKRPLLEAGRIVDKIFGNEIATPLRDAADVVRKAITGYQIAEQKRVYAEMQRKREEESRRVHAEEVARAKAEAEQAALEAEQSNEPLDVDAAIAAEQAALEAEYPSRAAVVAPTRAEVAAEARVVGDAFGARTSLAGRWVATVVDPAAVPRAYCTPDQRLITAAMQSSIPAKGREPTIKIPGVEITFEQNVRISR